MDDLSTQPQEFGVVRAASEWDPSGGVNPEWVWQKPEPEVFEEPKDESGGRPGEAILALVLAAAFLFFVILSW